MRLDRINACSMGMGRFTKAQTRNFSHTMRAQKKLLRKRNSDRYREPQQRFRKAQTGLYTIRAMYSISQHRWATLCQTVVDNHLDVRVNRAITDTWQESSKSTELMGVTLRPSLSSGSFRSALKTHLFTMHRNT